MLTSHTGHGFRSFIYAVTDFFSQKEHIRSIALAALVIACGIGGYFGYRWYDSRKQAEAQYSFGMLLDQFNTAFEKQDTDFAMLAQDFGAGYETHKNTAIAPYFLSFQADALLQAGNKKEALQVMDKAVTAHTSATPLLNLMKTKRALLALDANDDEARQQQGLNELEKLGQDTTNMYRDYALYHLGMYHWIHENSNAARLAWQELVDIQDTGMFSASPWASLVAEKLQSIS